MIFLLLVLLISTHAFTFYEGFEGTSDQMIEESGYYRYKTSSPYTFNNQYKSFGTTQPGTKRLKTPELVVPSTGSIQRLQFLYGSYGDDVCIYIYDIAVGTNDTIYSNTTGDKNQWSLHRYDISQYAGKSIQVYFSFSTKYNWQSGEEHFKLDEIMIITEPPTDKPAEVVFNLGGYSDGDSLDFNETLYISYSITDSNGYATSYELWDGDTRLTNNIGTTLYFTSLASKKLYVKSIDNEHFLSTSDTITLYVKAPPIVTFPTDYDFETYNESGSMSKIIGFNRNIYWNADPLFGQDTLIYCSGSSSYPKLCKVSIHQIEVPASGTPHVFFNQYIKSRTENMYVTVEIRDNSDQETLLYEMRQDLSHTDIEFDWRRNHIDLSPFAGDTISLKFQATMGSGLWAIDNISFKDTLISHTTPILDSVKFFDRFDRPFTDTIIQMENDIFISTFNTQDSLELIQTYVLIDDSIVAYSLFADTSISFSFDTYGEYIVKVLSKDIRGTTSSEYTQTFQSRPVALSVRAQMMPTEVKINEVDYLNIEIRGKPAPTVTWIINGVEHPEITSTNNWNYAWTPTIADSNTTAVLKLENSAEIFYSDTFAINVYDPNPPPSSSSAISSSSISSSTISSSTFSSSRASSSSSIRSPLSSSVAPIVSSTQELLLSSTALLSSAQQLSSALLLSSDALEASSNISILSSSAAIFTGASSASIPIGVHPSSSQVIAPLYENTLNIVSEEFIRYKVYDIFGRMILEKNHLSENFDGNSLGLVKGVYVVKHFTPNGSSMSQVIKVK